MADDNVIDLPPVEHKHINQHIALAICPYVEDEAMLERQARENIRTTGPDVDILLQIRGNGGELLVNVYPSGRVELGPTYEPDYTARRFWSSLAWFAEQHGRLEP